MFHQLDSQAVGVAHEDRRGAELGVLDACLVQHSTSGPSEIRDGGVELRNAQRQVRESQSVHRARGSVSDMSGLAEVHELDPGAVSLEIEGLELGSGELQEGVDGCAGDVELRALPKPESIAIEDERAL